MDIRHFAHKHHLKFMLMPRTHSWPPCSICEDVCSGPSYACRECHFSIHKSCAELPREFQNPFHPHPLTLTIASKSPLPCNVCDRVCSTFTYRCNLCDVVVDLKCAFVMPTVNDNQLQHFSHFHPLDQMDIEDDGSINCFACSKICSSGPVFCCIKCRFFLHKSCAELQMPQEIQHFFHPCTLTLRTNKRSLHCHACRLVNIRGGFSYYCDECHFELDFECALLPSTIKSDSKEQLLQHFSHGHPLTLSVKKESDQVQCSGCEKHCFGQTYVCGRCEFFLHKSCVGTAPEIRHPFHPNHPLTLCFESPNPFLSVCNACGIKCKGFTYFCAECRFELHSGCSELLPTIQYEGHSDHLLTFMEKINGERLKCNSCKTTCEGSSVFRCVQCDFNLHLECGPLPCTIQDKCHIDALTLTDSPVDHEVVDEVYCCDVCEKERDPGPAIYYCAECKYIAELRCVISEVIFALKGKYGEAKLRTTSNQITGKVLQISSGQVTCKVLQTSSSQITGKVVGKSNKNKQKEEVPEIIKTTLSLHDLLKSLTKDENLEINDVLVNAQKEMVDAKILSDYKNNEHFLEVFLLSENSCKLYMERLESGNQNRINLWDENEEIIAVRDYMITRSLAPILEKLCSKYGDISAESTLSPMAKSFFFVMLCGTIDSMLKSNFDDFVFEFMLLNWWHNLKVLKAAGFKIQFALDHLERVSHAYFGIVVEQKIEKGFAELDANITDISEEVEDLTIHLDAKKIELEGLKEKLQLIRSAESAKSNLIEECLEEASQFNCRTAGEGLL